MRIDDTPVHKALREALANCLANTDFYVPRGVVIKKENNLLILENPGYIRTGKEQMRKGGESDPRNKALMKMFNLINIGERAGSGVPDIFQTWDQEGWVEPIIEERYGDAARTILTLSFEKNVSQKDLSDAAQKTAQKTAQKSDKSEALIQYCREPRTREEMMEFLGIKHRTTFRNTYLKPLLETEKLFMTYPEKPRSKNQKFYSEVKDDV